MSALPCYRQLKFPTTVDSSSLADQIGIELVLGVLVLRGPAWRNVRRNSIEDSSYAVASFAGGKAGSIIRDAAQPSDRPALPFAQE